jgi:hypothetical protein
VALEPERGMLRFVSTLLRRSLLTVFVLNQT